MKLLIFELKNSATGLMQLPSDTSLALAVDTSSASLGEFHI